MKATSEELTIFVAVVESGSFSRAAEQLGQANSAISRSVKKLEMKLGVSLLNRTTRQLSLTEEGERYFRRVQSVLQEMAAAETEIMETRSTPRGLLRWGWRSGHLNIHFSTHNQTPSSSMGMVVLFIRSTVCNHPLSMRLCT